MPNNNPAGERAQTRVPRHIAIILDGNGRWAKKRGLPRTAGHAVGAETLSARRPSAKSPPTVKISAWNT